MRDVLFFTTAVLVLIWALHDGHLTWRESSGMVLLYALYVGVVVAGNWAARRRRRKREAAELAAWNRDIAAAGEAQEDVEDDGAHHALQHDVLPNLHIPPAALAKRAKSSTSGTTGPVAPSPFGQVTPTASSSRASSLNGSPLLRAARAERRGSRAVSAQIHMLSDHDDDDYGDSGPRANFSLLGAIEFRDVVNSLRKTPGSSHPSSPLATPRRPGARPTEDGEYFGAAARPSHRRSVSAIAPHSPDGPHVLHNPAQGRKRASSHLPLPESRQLAHLRAEETAGHARRQESAPPVPQTIEFHQVEPNVWQDQAGRPPTPSVPAPPASKPERLHLEIPSSRRASLADASSDSGSETPTELPTISVTDPQGIARQETFSSGIETRARLEPVGPRRPGESRYRLRMRMRQVLRVLFPSLQSFRHKSLVGMAMAVLSVPAILALTVTLPVVDDGRSDEGAVALPEGDDEPLNEHCLGPYERVEEDDEDDPDADERGLTPEIGEELHHLVEGGFSPMRSPLGRISHTKLRRALHDEEGRIRSNGGDAASTSDASGDDDDAEEDEMTKELVEDIRQEEVLEFNKYLTAVQCVLGPLFCVWIVFGESDVAPERNWRLRLQAKRI